MAEKSQKIPQDPLATREESSQPSGLPFLHGFLASLPGVLPFLHRGLDLLADGR